jgi:hypothetical protein
MKRLLLVLFLLPLIAWSQKFSVKGQLTDTLSSPLPSATIMILLAKDSSLVNFGVSDQKGQFEIKNINRGEYLLKVSFVGYDTYTQRITPAEGLIEMNLGQVKLKTRTTELEEVVVRAERAPVTVKRDTIEFNAESFKTKANANVEDLLKKMPGIDVESDGTVRAQGEQVQRVTVDGKEFFGRDPKLATRNLPADAVDKVQVFDKKSEQSTFTGIDDGQREKTINLELKEEKRNGAFGTLTGGIGTDGRYTAKGNLNKFSKGKQLSFLGMGNNVNEQGFSISDYMNFSGGSQQMMAGSGGGGVRLTFDGNNSGGVPLNFGGRQNGIVTNYAGGLNFNQVISKKTEVNGSYFYNYLDQDIDRNTERTNYLPGGDSYNSSQDSRQHNINENHRLNFTLEHKIDSSNSLRFTSSASYSNTLLTTASASETMSTSNTPQNSSTNFNKTDGTGFSVNSNLLYRHRFAKKGRSVSLNALFNISDNDSDTDLSAENFFYSGPTEQQSIERTTDQASSNQSLGATLAYIEPLGGRKYLELNYNFRTNINDVDRDVYDLGGTDPVFNELLSNAYTSNYIYHRPGLALRINRKKFNVSFGANWQQTRLDGRLKLLEVDINKDFQNILPNLRFNYDFSNLRSLRLEYETSMQEPTIQQLQPVIDFTTSQINQSIGNPDLGPGYNHRMNLHFTTFDPGRFINFFAMINSTYISNAISYQQTVNEDLSTLTMPVNVDYNMSANGNFNFGFPITKLKSRFNIGPVVTRSASLALINELATGAGPQKIQTNQQTLGGTVRYNFSYKEIFTLDLSANLSDQQTNYLSESALTPEAQEYFNKTYTAETFVTILKNWQFNAAFDYLVYTSQTNGFNQELPLMNLFLSRFILKAQSGEIKVGVVNLFDRSMSVSQSASVNYLEQTTYNNLGRYFMLSFTYSLNKQLNPMGAGGRRGGPRMMMMRN